MGFGTLFIGYFLLLNFTYFGLTDIIAAGIMAAGLYKLSSVNREFRYAFYLSVAFCIYAVPELGLFALRILEIHNDPTLTGYISVGSAVIVSVLTALIMRGIYSVSREVELERIPRMSMFSFYSAFGVYALYILCNAPFLSDLFGSAVAILYLFAIVLLLLYVGFNLYVIYSCYMRICMPGEEDGRAEAPSRFGFINKMREEKAARERENYEYRMKRLSEKQKKRKRK